MRIRIFRASTLAEAMAQIRSELGPDALILSDRNRDGFVEVTAALETGEAPELREPARPRPRPELGPDDLEPFHANPAPTAPSPRPAATVAHAILAWHGLPPALIALLQAGPLEQACARAFRFAAPGIGPADPPFLLAGPPGAGKTLTVARLATRLVLAGQSPLVITADGRRAGAVEQLAAFTRLLGLTLVAANTPAMLVRALERRTDGQPVLIDAPGLHLDDAAQAETLRELLAASGAAAALVLPCGLDPAEAQEIATAHAALGARMLVATRTDLSRRMGGILCAAAAADLALCEAGVGSDAADGLVALTPAFLAERLQGGGRTDAAATVRPTPAADIPPAPQAGILPAPRAGILPAPRAGGREADPVIMRSALSLHIAAQRRASSSL